MTIFEYLSVAISIVLSLAIVRLVNGIPYVTAPAKRYWIHVAWVFGLAVQIIVLWWNMWAYRQVIDWILPEFALLLLTPVAAYYLSATLIPDSPATVDSWRSHFFQIRRRFFLAAIFLFFCFFLNTLVLLEIPLLHPLRVGQGIAVALLLIGALSESPRVHAILISILLCGFAAVIAGFFLRPGGFATS